MDRNIEISFLHFEPTDRIRARIEELIGELEKFEDDIVSGRVVIDGKNKHGQKSVVSIHVELTYPGGLAIGKRSGEFPNPAGQQTFDTALTEAFHTAASQIRDHFQKINPTETKRLSHQPQHGRIERLNATVRNGFIEIPDAESLFFSEAVLRGDFDTLREGDEVLATAADEEGPYGPQASVVKPIGPLA
jgi:ribosome-associated translation inhibitor RaiA/cold shock CspA family protein